MAWAEGMRARSLGEVEQAIGLYVAGCDAGEIVGCTLAGGLHAEAGRADEAFAWIEKGNGRRAMFEPFLANLTAALRSVTLTSTIHAASIVQLWISETLTRQLRTCEHEFVAFEGTAREAALGA